MKKKENIRSAQDVDVYAGERLKKRRKEMGYSQKVLADFIGVTFQQIQKYEKGLNRIGASRLHQFCIYLKVKPSYFFRNIDYINKEQSEYKFAEKAGDKNASEQIFRLLSAFNHIKDENKREKVIELLETFGEQE